MKRLLLAIITLFLVSSASAQTYTVTSSPTVTVGTYASGDQVGGLLTFTIPGPFTNGARAGFITSVDITNKNGDAGNLVGDLYLFDSIPTAGTSFGDKVGLTMGDADLLKKVGRLPIVAANCSAFVANGSCELGNQSFAFQLNSSSVMYGVFIARGAVTFASTSDVQFKLGVQVTR